MHGWGYYLAFDQTFLCSTARVSFEREIKMGLAGASEIPRGACGYFFWLLGSVYLECIKACVGGSVPTGASKRARVEVVWSGGEGVRRRVQGGRASRLAGIAGFT